MANFEGVGPVDKFNSIEVVQISCRNTYIHTYIPSSLCIPFMPRQARMTIALNFHNPFPTLLCWYKLSNHKNCTAPPNRNAIKFILIYWTHSISGRSIRDGAHISWLPDFPLARDFLLASWSEAGQLLQAHCGPLHFIFSVAKEVDILTKV